MEIETVTRGMARRPSLFLPGKGTYHDGKGASRAQYPEGFSYDGLCGLLRQLMHDQADRDQIHRAVREAGVLSRCMFEPACGHKRASGWSQHAVPVAGSNLYGTEFRPAYEPWSSSPLLGCVGRVCAFLLPVPHPNNTT